MFTEALLAIAFQIGPFYEQRTDLAALRPIYAEESETTDVLWPVFTAHRDWWRAFFFIHYQDYAERGYQFEIDPVWWNGRDEHGDFYCGFFPLGGYHPHALLMYDAKFALWPLWHQYKMPRKSAADGWMETNAVLWPFIHWREDGSWGFWPLYVQNHQRESDHYTVLWPLVTWATYRADRDTGGDGYSWMFFPLWAEVDREREKQSMFLPPLFSYAETPQGWRLRCPWPLFEMEHRTTEERLSIFPFYESSKLLTYKSEEPSSSVTRFGWKFIELYDDETRVFPFWVSRKDDSYFRLWPFWESERGEDKVERSRFLSVFPIRWVPAVNRNWSKFWTFYERERQEDKTHNSLLWGIIQWDGE